MNTPTLNLPTSSVAPSHGRVPGERERLVFFVCSALILLYIVAEAFVFLEPGVHRSSHIHAAVVPGAIVVLALIFYGRMHAGLRATIALLFGVFSLVAGLVELSDLLRNGLSGDGVLGILVAVAGIALVVLGADLLWISRKRGGSLAWTIARRTLLSLAALFVVYWAVIPVSMAIFATERPRDDVQAADVGRPYQEVTFDTSDGLTLSAWYVPSENGATVVTFPRAWTIKQAGMLVSHGYGVLMVDPRGYGESEGDPNAYGWGCVKDIAAATAWLRRQPGIDAARVGGLGLSMGGEQMIEAAASNEDLSAVVSEGAGFRSVRESLVREGANSVELYLQYPQDLMQSLAVWVLGGEAPPPSLETAAAQISPRAVFFIYSEKGAASEDMLNGPYYAAADEPKAVWAVPDAGHTGGIKAQPEEYERRVIAFFDRELAAR